MRSVPGSIGYRSPGISMPGERHGAGTVSLNHRPGVVTRSTWCSRSVFGETHRRRSVTTLRDEFEAIVDRYHKERLWYSG